MENLDRRLHGRNRCDDEDRGVRAVRKICALVRSANSTGTKFGFVRGLRSRYYVETVYVNINENILDNVPRARIHHRK